jgi:hypothetical protein
MAGLLGGADWWVLIWISEKQTPTNSKSKQTSVHLFGGVSIP